MTGGLGVFRGIALVIELVWPGSRIRVFARSPRASCIYVARGLVLVCAEGSTKSFIKKRYGAWKATTHDKEVRPGCDFSSH